MSSPSVSIRVLAFLALLLAAPLVGAQTYGQSPQGQPPQGQPPQGQPPQGQPGGMPAEVDQATVEKFVGALVEVQGIQQEFSKELQDVKDREQAQQLQVQAQQEMMKAVENNGLSIEEYNQVVSMMNQDGELRNKILERAARHNDAN